MDKQALKNDLLFLHSFAPAQSPDEVTPRLAPMFYVTLSYEGDVALAQRVQSIKNSYNINDDDIDDIDLG